MKHTKSYKDGQSSDSQSGGEIVMKYLWIGTALVAILLALLGGMKIGYNDGYEEARADNVLDHGTYKRMRDTWQAEAETRYR
jgi:hypothetical protein